MRIVLALALAAALAACAQPKELSVDGAWVRLGAVPGRPAAGYFTVHGGPAPATLIAVTTDVAIKAEMHETMAKGGMSQMTPLARVDIPAGADVAFKPGGRHVMLFNVNPGIKRGSRFVFTFSFADGTRILRNANVIAAGDPSPKVNRALTDGETALAASVFGDAIDYGPVRLARSKWAFFQPRDTVMAPRGCIHFHPQGDLWCDDFAHAHLDRQGLFIHEMVHIWQHQRGVFLPLARHPWCRYDYAFRPGVTLKRYGIEQQAEIVRHAFLLRCGATVPGAPSLAQYETLLPFRP